MRAPRLRGGGGLFRPLTVANDSKDAANIPTRYRLSLRDIQGGTLAPAAGAGAMPPAGQVGGTPSPLRAFLAAAGAAPVMGASSLTLTATMTPLNAAHPPMVALPRGCGRRWRGARVGVDAAPRGDAAGRSRHHAPQQRLRATSRAAGDTGRGGDCGRQSRRHSQCPCPARVWIWPSCRPRRCSATRRRSGWRTRCVKSASYWSRWSCRRQWRRGRPLRWAAWSRLQARWKAWRGLPSAKRPRLRSRCTGAQLASGATTSSWLLRRPRPPSQCCCGRRRMRRFLRGTGRGGRRRRFLASRSGLVGRGRSPRPEAGPSCAHLVLPCTSVREAGAQLIPDPACDTPGPGLACVVAATATNRLLASLALVWPTGAHHPARGKVVCVAGEPAAD